MLKNKLTPITPEQEALIPVYWQKWINFSLSTERLNQQKAMAAARVYCVAFDLEWRNIYVLESPDAAIDYLTNHSAITPELLWYESIIERMNYWHTSIIDYAEELVRISDFKEIRNKRLLLYDWGRLVWLVEELQRPVYKQLNIESEIFEGWLNIVGLDLVACRFLLDYFTSVLNWNFEWKEASAAYKFLIHTSDWILHDGTTCIVCDRPIKNSLNRGKHPELEHEPLMVFSDGFTVHSQPAMPLAKSHKHH